MSTETFISYGGRRLAYRLNADPHRTARVAIHVEPDGEVIVDAPLGAETTDIQRAVHKRARWVFTQVEKAQERQRHSKPKEYVSGEEVLYLGRRYVLKVLISNERRQPAKLKGNRLEVITETGSSEDVRARVWAWYKVRGRDYFNRRLTALSDALPWVKGKPAFQLKDMAKRWGSCTPTGEIIINPHLVKAPRECIDYVLLHELAHLKHHDHGPAFWHLIYRFDPGWRAKKDQLDAMVETIMMR